MSDTFALTYRELAERLGINPDSARMKASRRKWTKVPGNHPGDPVRVLVPVEFFETARAPHVREEHEPRTKAAEDTRVITALEDHIATLKADLDRERGRIAALEAELVRLKRPWWRRVLGK